MAFDRASTAKDKACIWSSYDPFKKASSQQQRTFSKAAFLTDEQFDALRYLQENFTPSENYKKWEDAKIADALSAIVNDEYIKQAALLWKSQSDYKNINDAHEQYRLKKEVLQRVSDHIRHSFDLKSISVLLYPFDVKSGQGGNYNFIFDQISINYDVRYGITDSFEKALLTIIEETKHSIDWALAAMLADGTIHIDDVKAPHAAAIWLNGKNIVGVEDRHRFNVIDFILSNGQPTLAPYEKQYIERNAKEFRKALADQITQELRKSSSKEPSLELM